MKRGFKLSVFLTLLEVSLMAATSLLNEEFITFPAEWQLRGATWQSNDHTVLLDGRKSSPVWLVTPLIRLKPGVSYRVTCRVKGTGYLWLHGWGYNDEKTYVGDMGEPVSGRKVTFESPDEWKTIGIRSFKMTPEATTCRLCLECQTSCLVQFANVTVMELNGGSEMTEVVAVPPLTIDKPVIHLGEWFEVHYTPVSSSETLATCSFLSPQKRSHALWPQESWPEKGLFRASPRQTGTHTVRLSLEDGMGNVGYSEIAVTVLPNELPVPHVVMSWLPDQRVRLDASASTDKEGPIADYRWELPDGTIRHGAVCDLLYKPYTAFNVYLTVTDSYGLSAQKELSILVPQPAEPALLSDGQPVIKLVVDKNGTVRSPDKVAVPLQLGCLEKILYSIENNEDTILDYQLDAAETVPYLEVKPVKGTVGAHQQVMCSLSVRTWLNVPHQAGVVFSAGTRKQRIDMDIAVQEKYPIFGTQEHFNRKPPQPDRALEDVRMLAELPCQVYRLPDVMCWFMQKRTPEGNSYDFTNADWAVQHLLNDGKTQVYPFLGYVPPDLNPLDDDFERKALLYREYVRELVKRYNGKIRYWEPFNEPPWNGLRNYGANGARVVGELTRILAEEVRNVDSQAKIVAPGYCNPGADFKIMADIIAAGGDESVDVYNFHEYTAHEFDSLDMDYDFKRENGSVMRLLKMLQEKGINKPLFVSESGGNRPQINEREQRIKALQFMRTCLIWLANGVSGIQQYEFMDYPHEPLPSHFAMVRYAEHYRLPMFFVFREIIKSLTGAEPCLTAMKHNDTATPSATVITLGDSLVRQTLFRRGEEMILAVWNCGEKPVELSLALKTEHECNLEEKSFSLQGDAFVTAARTALSSGTLSRTLQGYQVQLLTVDRYALLTCNLK